MIFVQSNYLVSFVMSTAQKNMPLSMSCLLGVETIGEADQSCMLRRFFEDYKKNENKEVKVDEILGREEALTAIKDAMVRLRRGNLLTTATVSSPPCLCTRATHCLLDVSSSHVIPFHVPAQELYRENFVPKRGRGG